MCFILKIRKTYIYFIHNTNKNFFCGAFDPPQIIMMMMVVMTVKLPEGLMILNE